MTLMEIANELVAGCREGREDANIDRLYAPDAVSVEPGGFSESSDRERHGIAAIREKHAWFAQAFEVVSQEVSDPMPHGDDRFAVIFKVTMRNRETGEEFGEPEVAVYHVSAGKIVREEFFYNAG